MRALYQNRKPFMTIDIPLLLERDGAVASLCFNRPSALNAIDPPMARAFLSAVRELAADPSVRAVIMRGAGKGFMAGGDLTVLSADPQRGATELIGPLHEAVRVLDTMDAPLVAQVHGVVAGAGLSLMLQADFVLAAAGTRFNPAHANIGASCDVGTSWAWLRWVAERIAFLLAARGVTDGGHGVVVRSFHSWCEDMMRTCQLQVNAPRSPAEAYFAELAATLERALASGFMPKGQYTAVMIDEAHDFEDAWLRMTVELVNPATKALLVLPTTRGRRLNMACLRARPGIGRIELKNAPSTVGAFVWTDCEHGSPDHLTLRCSSSNGPASRRPTSGRSLPPECQQPSCSRSPASDALPRASALRRRRARTGGRPRRR